MNVSLVITCHNQKKYLVQLIKLLQDFPEVLRYTEIIVIDSSNVPIQMPPPICVYSIPNRGPSAARNFGAEKAKGKWLIFCDADDLVSPHVIAFFQRSSFNLSCDAYFFPYKRVFDEEIIQLAHRFYDENRVPATVNAVAIQEPFYFLTHFFPVHAFAVKRSIMQKVKFNEEQWFIEDVRFYLELALIPEVQLFSIENNCFTSFHRDFKDRRSLSTSNDLLFWKSVCANYDFLVYNNKLSLKAKVLLVKLVILNYHLANSQLKEILTSENKIIWRYFLGLPKLFRSVLLYRLLLKFHEFVKWLKPKIFSKA